MTILLNGEPKAIEPRTSVAALIESLAIRQARIAVEVNQTIIRREAHPEHLLAEGDQVEIIHFVGGG